MSLLKKIPRKKHQMKRPQWMKDFEKLYYNEVDQTLYAFRYLGKRVKEAAKTGYMPGNISAGFAAKRRELIKLIAENKYQKYKQEHEVSEEDLVDELEARQKMGKVSDGI